MTLAPGILYYSSPPHRSSGREPLSIARALGKCDRRLSYDQATVLLLQTPPRSTTPRFQHLVQFAPEPPMQPARTCARGAASAAI